MTSRARYLPLVGAISVVIACAEPAAAPRFDEVAQLQPFAGSEWSEPVHLDAPINSPARELGASLSPDGLSLYFGSDRLGSLGGFDIWVSHRACDACPWEAPQNLGSNINSAAGDGGPALSHDGLLLFFSGSRDGGEGGEDIWVSRRTDPNDDLSWGPAINLGPDVNTAVAENGPAYIPVLESGGANLYFIRAGNIYAAQVTRDGEPLGPAVPVEELNYPGAATTGLSVRADGREVYFSSTRPGLGGSDIWVATRRSPTDPWSAPEDLDAVINTFSADVTPSLSWDRRALFFSAGAAARPSLGLQDIWVSTRTPSGR